MRPSLAGHRLDHPSPRSPVETCDGTLTGLWDRALILLGFAAALRRSEIIAREVTDVAVVARAYD